MPSKIDHHAIQPTIMIGKAGITESIVKQTKEQLRRRKVIKVRFLPSAVKGNKKELVKELVQKSKAKLIHAVGFIAVLERIK